MNDGDNDEKDDDKIADKERDRNFQDMEDLQLNPVIGDGKNEYINGNYSSCNNKNAFTPVHRRNFIGQIKSVEFLFIMLFASMQMLKANTYLVSNFLTFEIFQYSPC